MIKTISIMLTLTLTLTMQLGSSVIATSNIDYMQIYKEYLVDCLATAEALSSDIENPDDTLEYALLDINDDGIDELFVWNFKKMTSGSYQNSYDCYTIKDGELSLVFSAGYGQVGSTMLSENLYIIDSINGMNKNTKIINHLSPTNELKPLIELQTITSYDENVTQDTYVFEYYDNGELVNKNEHKLDYGLIDNLDEMIEFNSYIGEEYEFTKKPISSILDTEIIKWHDDIIEASVRHQLNKPTGDISASDVLDITELLDIKKPYVNGKYEKVQNIEDLKYLTNLKSLSLVHNEISDISPLENLKQLEFLFLNNNQISDISALTGLSNLKRLLLYNNQISDISQLTRLQNLEVVLLSNNNIFDISSLPQMKINYKLNLSNNNISDISVLPQLQNISQLDLSNNNISDISVLTGTKDLMYLDIRNNNITDFTPGSQWSDYNLKK